MTGRGGALEAVERILNRGGARDEVLRAVVEALHERCEGLEWVAVTLADGGELAAGRPPADGGDVAVPIVFEGRVVGELGAASGGRDRALLERVATLVSAYCRLAGARPR